MKSWINRFTTHANEIFFSTNLFQSIRTWIYVRCIATRQFLTHFYFLRWKYDLIVWKWSTYLYNGSLSPSRYHSTINTTSPCSNGSISHGNIACLLNTPRTDVIGTAMRKKKIQIVEIKKLSTFVWNRYAF